MSDQKKRRTTRRNTPLEKNVPGKLCVLVASSTPVTAAGLEGLLRSHSYLEVIASAGDAHWEYMLRDTEADVLVLDVDGRESDSRFLDLIARFAGTIPIIVVVAEVSSAWITRALRAGVRGVLPRGISAEELASAVRTSASGLVTLSPEIMETVLGRPLPVDSDEIEMPAESLTAREQQVLAMLAEGLLNKEIADRLHISEHTVKFHISSIMGKLGASSRTEAVTRGIRLGLVFL